MNKLMCPVCEKMIMSIDKVESLLRNTFSKVLLSHCVCGEALEIRSPRRNVFKISTASGKQSEIFIKNGEGM